jgi:hypothetical protein
VKSLEGHCTLLPGSIKSFGSASVYKPLVQFDGNDVSDIDHIFVLGNAGGIAAAELQEVLKVAKE